MWPYLFVNSLLLAKTFLFNPFLGYLTFLAINLYLPLLIALNIFNAKLFRKTKLIATALPIILVPLFMIGAIWVARLVNIVHTIESNQNIEKPIEPKKSDLCCGFTKDSINICYNGILLANADISTFKIINSNWAKDTNSVYYFGEPILYIDSKTFRNIDSEYSVDIRNAYYFEQIVVDADPLTFKYVTGTDFYKDKNFIFKKGVKIASFGEN